MNWSVYKVSFVLMGKLIDFVMGEEKLEGENEVDGHEKKSYLHKVKDKAMKMKDKVKKKIHVKGHGEEEAEEESEEELDQTPRKYDEPMEANKDSSIEKEEIETGVGNLSIKDTGAEPMVEKTPHFSEVKSEKTPHFTEVKYEETQYFTEVKSEETPKFTEEVKSEETSHFNEVKSEETPNFTEEVKSGGSGGMTKESGLVQGQKDVVPSDESIKDNKEDTIGEGECKGTQPKQNEGGGKGAQSYAQKLYAAKDAIASMLGYGGQTNEKNNEVKKGEQIQGTTRGIGTAMEDDKENKETCKSGIVHRLSPGEDEKALSEVITGLFSKSARGVKDGKAKSSSSDAIVEDSQDINGQTSSTNPSEGKGVVKRVSGVFSSFVGKKQANDVDQLSSGETLKSESQPEVLMQNPPPVTTKPELE